MEGKIKICIIGLGYVGLPLFKVVSQYFDCRGLDNSASAIKNIKCQDFYSDNMALTSDWNVVLDCNVFIVCVPTPIKENNEPDLSSLGDVCESLGKVIKNGDVVIFESTVYPGATEEYCVPILEKYSDLCCNIDFFVGYSPERINVGDTEHTINRVPKIVSGSNSYATKAIANIYRTILGENIVIAPSIKVAEAAKMYENVQRDVLIALANEYADYCRVEGIDIEAVTECASTKWNFTSVNPGLVGGHCISVDPYYMMAKAKMKDVAVPLIKTAREVNESKPSKIADRIVDCINHSNKITTNAKVLILGFSYKPNISDIRNTKVYDVIKYLTSRSISCDCIDPWVDTTLAKEVYGVNVFNHIDQIADEYDLVVNLVLHKVFDSEAFLNLHPIKLNELV